MRIGHKSSAIDNYIRESTQLQVEVSKILESISCEPKSEPISESNIESNNEFNSGSNSGSNNASSSVIETITSSENINERPIAIEVCRGSKNIKSIALIKLLCMYAKYTTALTSAYHPQSCVINFVTSHAVISFFK